MLQEVYHVYFSMDIMKCESMEDTMDSQMSVQQSKVKYSEFLKDVGICALGSYGGPEAHYGVFTDQMVEKKKYLSEEELLELIALTSILPGPSSTQTIVAIGYKVGGAGLAFLTMLVWALPAILIMTAFSFLSQFLAQLNLSQNGLRYIGPMASAFIFVAAIRLGKKVIKDWFTVLLVLFGAIFTYFFKAAWVYPLVLFVGGFASIVKSQEKNL